jgi:PilZ domain/SPOR domain
MSLPVMKPDRRRTPRTIPEGLAYINFEPDNGGIVLNISDKGLCFQSVAPIQPNGVIRFWFSAEGNRIDAQGRLAWIDEKRKTGGLEFKALSTEAQRQIHSWITQSTKQFAAEGKPSATVPPSLPRSVWPPVSPSVALPASASDQSATASARVIAVVRPAAQNVFSRWLRPPVRWAEFSRGLAAGLLIGLVAAAVFLFHTHRRQVGELLIRTGEHFGATPRLEASPPAPVPEPTAQQRTMTSQPAPIPARRSDRPLLEPLTKPVSSPRSKLEPQRSVPAIPPISLTEPLPTATLTASFPIPSEPGKVAQPEVAGHPAAEAKVLKLKPAGHPVENAEDTAELNSGVPLGKYFEIGRFKEDLWADEKVDDLTHLGFQALVIPKNLLWMTSYQVLVGPYSNEEDAQAARRNLQSRGLRPRSLPRRSREFSLPTMTKLYSDRDVVENFVVSWESYSADATVKFVKGGDTVATGQGKWVKRPDKYQYDGVMYDGNVDGSRTLLEIWFRGMNQAVVFPTTVGNHAIIF